MSTLNFRKQVRIELIKRGMTMSDLARQMGISGDYLRKIVRGKRKATERRQEIKTILKLKENSNEEQKNGFSTASGTLGAALNSYNIPSPEAEGVHSLRLAISGDGKGDKDERR